MSIKVKKTAVPTCTVEITKDHTGKMLGMQSISTSCRLNPGCIRNSKIPGSICEHCYAQTMLQMFNGLDARVERNTALLTTKLIDWNDLPVVNCQIFRFESFGDIHNEVHLQNYINITKKNPGCRFTLWTKNYKVAYEYFKTHDCPENFTLIISSLFVNKKQDIQMFKDLGKFAKGQLKVFTVYDYEYIKNHHDELTINCGSRLCIGCRKCYEKNEIEEINEILKSDQERTEKFLDTLEPDYNDRMAKALEEIDELNMFGEDKDEESLSSLDIDSEEEDSECESMCSHCCGSCPYAGKCGKGDEGYSYEGEDDEILEKEIRNTKVDNLMTILGDKLKSMEAVNAEVTIGFLTEFTKKLYEGVEEDDKEEKNG